MVANIFKVFLCPVVGIVAASPGAPRSGRAWGLAEAGFVFEENGGLFALGFFLDWISVTNPFGLKRLVCPGQDLLRPLDGELKAVQDT